MAKRLVVLTVSLMIPFFISGCPSVEPELAEPPEVDTRTLQQAEPDKIEPVYVEPDKTKPDEIEPVVTEPDEVEIAKAEPNGPELSEAEPGEVLTVEPEPNEVELSKAKPNGPELSEAEPGEVSTAEPEPNDVELSKAEPNEPEPGEIAPAAPEPNEVEATSAEPNNLETPKVEPNDLKPEPATAFHDKCAGMLKDFVDDKGMVDYEALRRKRHELRALLEEFNRLDPHEYKSWPKEDRIAFWINVYNLQKLKVVTDNYPIQPLSRWLTILYGGTSSIRHIEAKIAKHKFLVMDEEFNFAIIEKRFFRSEFGDPRIFFALSDACLSSPPLRDEPYYGRKLGEQLDDQTKRFLSSPRAFRIDREEQTVYLSAKFQSSWYGNEFIKKFAIDRKFKDQTPETRAVLNFITNYVPKQEVSFLEVGNYTIKYMKYDWTINDGS